MTMYPFLKRATDIGISLVALIICAPLMLAIAAAVRLGSSGSALYRAPRIGRHGRSFNMLKFRTMIADADRRGGSSTAAGDPRVTRIGAVLRRYKLDELPQFVNVLRGDMSLVGPRPQIAWAVALYTAEQRRLLSVRPGITDFASIRFRNEAEILSGSTDPDRDYLEKIAPEKLRLGLAYVDTQSLWVDATILWKTFFAAVGAEDAGAAR